MSNTPETDAALYPMNQVDIVWPEFARKLERERDEARTELEMWHDGNIIHLFHRDELEKTERERDEANHELTNIYLWIERNHSDGFIDSLSYSQNLERVTDSWYDRLERVERERDEAREDAQKSKAYKRVLKETNLRQTERIRYLEGATNHAEGTPLSIALRERDEAREALMKIEDLFIDGTDIYADREKMGMIARNALEETK